MTTVWRPRVRIPVPDIDGADVDEKRRDELTTKGTKRKRAPPQRALRARGEASLEVQGVQCLSARSSAPSVQGVRWVTICEHGRRRSHCKECGGSQICEHGRQRSKCKECGGSHICEHGRERSQCKECGGSQICEHGRQRY